MRYDFAKLNGIGNDFVMIEDLDDEILLTPEQITALCDRHFGIGGDGVIIVKPSPRPECGLHGLLQLRWNQGANVRQRRTLLREVPRR